MKFLGRAYSTRKTILTSVSIGFVAMLCAATIGLSTYKQQARKVGPIVKTISQPAQNGRPAGLVLASITTPSGAVLRSFFEGLPIDEHFKAFRAREAAAARQQRPTRAGCAARSANLPARLERFALRARQFLGLTGTVHAQEGCAGCYQMQFELMCTDYGCDNNWIYTITDSDPFYKDSGAGYIDDFGCGGDACGFENEYNTCDDSASCG